jgi:CRISPR-associated protein Cmr2
MDDQKDEKKPMDDKELILFQLGPVQDFIAQAETLEDLREGSRMLSEWTAAALRTIPDYANAAVFPAVASEKPEDLDGIPNRFLVFVPKGQGETLAEKAVEAAQARLREMAHAVLEKLNLSDSRCDEFNKQVGAFLQTSWAVLKKPSEDMGENYKEIGRLMALRRNVRAFDAWPEEESGRVKDFLSGREAALDVADNDAPNRNCGRGALNLIKKMRGESDKVKSKDSLKSEEGKAEKYIAVIALDGDHMGGTLSGFKTQDEHRKFSQKLMAFASDVEKMFDEGFNVSVGKTAHFVKPDDGFLVYAGGDDVLAVVKATDAFEVAQAISKKFKDEVGTGLTASVGIAIGSNKAPLQDLVREAQSAEHRAKRDYGRDALAVSVLKRSGETLRWGCKWNSAAFAIYRCLVEQEGAFSRFAYKLAGFLEPYDLGSCDEKAWEKMSGVVLAETQHALGQMDDKDKVVKVQGVLTDELLGKYLKEGSVKAHPEDYLGLFLCEAFINRKRSDGEKEKNSEMGKENCK